jgi:hypothetical protein
MMELKKLRDHSDSNRSEARFRSALEQAQILKTKKFEQLDLELEAFDDPEYAAQIAKLGDTGLEDLKPFLNENNA